MNQAPPPPAAAGRYPPGTRIAGYELESYVGQGASAEVYRAVETQTKRVMALKVLTGAVESTPQGSEPSRFEREVRTALSLKHPDIVDTRAAGLHRGQPWLAMEWIPGHDLSRYTIAQRLLPETLAIEIIERLARALAHAHRQGIVHRDVKPGNVRVHLPAGIVKLTDFGIARAEDGTQTRTGVMLGTPAYMAPEQLAGSRPEPRADMYSLAVMAFELLTARRPHESASMGDLLRQIMSEEAPSLQSLRPDLPNELNAVLASALAKNPKQRPADGDALADALAKARVLLG